MKAIFLDRDGVINKYPGHKKYVTSVKQFKFLPGAKKAIQRLTLAGYKIFIISNQAGVGKGVYSQKALDAITSKMISGLAQAKGKIEAVYYCIHRPQANCACRKPNTGSIKKAKKEFALDVKGAYFIGDSIRDVMTAKSAGLKSVLVLSGREKLSNWDVWESEPDFIFPDLWEAVKFILRASRL
jgi:histidinol-phosphate phosphatase family protein